MLRQLLCVLVAAQLLGCGGSEPPSEWIATVRWVKGTVLAGRQGQPLKQVQKSQYLLVGDRMETRAASEAVLALRNGGQLTIKPDSVVLFGSSSPRSKLRLMLEQGSVTGTGSRVSANELLIATGGRRVLLGQETTVTIVAPEQRLGEARVIVTYGQATVEEPGAKPVTVVAGKELIISTRAKPDAGVGPSESAARAAKRYFLQSVGRGRVTFKLPDAKQFALLRKGTWMEAPAGTALKLVRGALARVGHTKEASAVLTGPAQLSLEAVPAGGDVIPLSQLQGEIVLAEQGKAGNSSTSFQLDGVKVTPRVTYQRVDLRIQRQGDRGQVIVAQGAAELKSAKQTLQLEAGQDAVVSNGKIVGPHMPPLAPFQVKQFGTVRLFTSEPRIAVTFRWKGEGAGGSLVRVSSKSPSMASPIFADVIKRSVLTVANVGHGTLYWDIGQVDAQGNVAKPETGRLMLVQDTSYRVLKNYRPPRNTIQESYGNTTVYYQNQLPALTFTWNPIEGAAKYHLKIYREQNLQDPMITSVTDKPSTSFNPGKVGEGNFIWYVVGRAADDKLVKALKSRRLSVHYDNATPDLQIVQPRNGLTTADAQIEAKGVTIPGSKVYIDNVEATLDKGFRFTHPIKLKPGVNYIMFRVAVPKRGSSFYLRRVTRQ